MWGSVATKLAVFLLRNTRLSNEHRQLLTTVLLDKLGALPMHARIVLDEASRLFVGGKLVNLETAQRLKEASRAMGNNFARKFVREQVVFMAIHKGVHENISPDQGLFAKAALYFYQEEDDLYDKLAQQEPE